MFCKRIIFAIFCKKFSAFFDRNGALRFTIRYGIKPCRHGQSEHHRMIFEILLRALQVSLGAVSVIIFPCSITIILSATGNSFSSLCSVIITVIPKSLLSLSRIVKSFLPIQGQADLRVRQELIHQARQQMPPQD